jgi:hypothetical protein
MISISEASSDRLAFFRGTVTMVGVGDGELDHLRFKVVVVVLLLLLRCVKSFQDSSGWGCEGCEAWVNSDH